MRRTLLLAAALAAASCAGTDRNLPASAADAKAFLDQVNAAMLKAGVQQARASWVAENFITDDTEAINARVTQEYTDMVAKFAKDSVRFDKTDVPADERRQLNLLKLSLVMATPSDPKDAEELTRSPPASSPRTARVNGVPIRRRRRTARTSTTITKLHRDVARREDAPRCVGGLAHDFAADAEGLRAVRRAVEQGREELGFADTGAMWRAKYDMPPDDFTKELDRLWGQVRPLYLKLHAYVRMKLHDKYGDVVPPTGPIPAHLLGNIWAQDWSNVYRSSHRPTRTPATRSPRFLRAVIRRRSTWSGPANTSTPLWVSRRCRRHSGSARCSYGRATATWCATRARGTSICLRCTHQNVHRPDGGRLLDDPSRAGA